MEDGSRATVGRRRMARTTAIEWTDATWTPIRARNLATGRVGWHCEHVTPGCDHCYAEGINRRLGTGLPFEPRRRNEIELFLDENMLRHPWDWPAFTKIFVCSMNDLFGSFVPAEFINRVFDTMDEAHHQTFQVLTKRTRRMCKYVNERYPNGEAPRHIWLGTSVEDGERLFRVNQLKETRATIRFLSIEPLIEPVADLDLDRIHQVIVGGESGGGARPMHPDWVRSIRDQCDAAGVAFFFKQWGEWGPGRYPDHPRARSYHFEDGTLMSRVRNKHSGSMLDGREGKEFPSLIRRRRRPPVAGGVAPGAAERELKETTMKAHRYAKLFPATGEAELAELADDIREYGQREAIETYGGTILDGRSRFKACEMVGIIPETHEFEGTDEEALALVVSRNLRRRHLTTERRAHIALLLTTMAKGRPKKNASNEALISQAEAAKTMGVSRASVQRAAKTKREDPEAHEAAKAGKPKPGSKPRAKPKTAEKSEEEDARLLGKAESAFKALDRRGKRRNPSFTAEQVHFVVGLLQSFRTAVSSDTKPLPHGADLLAEARALASVLDDVGAKSRGSAGPVDAAEVAAVEAGKAAPIRQRQREANRRPQSQGGRLQPPPSTRATPL